MNKQIPITSFAKNLKSNIKYDQKYEIFKNER
jgi:hypothetical protein